MASGQDNTVNVPLYTTGETFSGPDITLAPSALVSPPSGSEVLPLPLQVPEGIYDPYQVTSAIQDASAPFIPLPGPEVTGATGPEVTGATGPEVTGATGPEVTGATGPGIIPPIFPFLTLDLVNSMFPSSQNTNAEQMVNFFNIYAAGLNSLNKKVDDLQLSADAIFETIQANAYGENNEYGQNAENTGNAEAVPEDIQEGGKRRATRKKRKGKYRR